MHQRLNPTRQLPPRFHVTSQTTSGTGGPGPLFLLFLPTHYDPRLEIFVKCPHGRLAVKCPKVEGPKCAQRMKKVLLTMQPNVRACLYPRLHGTQSLSQTVAVNELRKNALVAC